MRPPRPTRPPVIVSAAAPPRGLLDVLHAQIAQQVDASHSLQGTGSQGLVTGEAGEDPVARLPLRLPPRPAPQPATFSDKPVVDWGLRPFVDYGSLRGTDPFGSGALGAPRATGKPNDGTTKQYSHQGVDVLVAADSPIYAPSAGYIRDALPKGPGGPPGVAITLKTLGIGEGGRQAQDDLTRGEVKMFYVERLPDLKPGTYVDKGQLIGYSRSLRPYYESRGIYHVPDHVHFELKQAVPRRNPDGSYIRASGDSSLSNNPIQYDYKIIDPTPWLQRWAVATKR
ncbi:hypothetical protein [Hypericibacter sp.]|uniref:hypothetical protein n=1 Tax=Hypericibacter sp. TaxID=2705401 RepID=UPI003D6D543F